MLISDTKRIVIVNPPLLGVCSWCYSNNGEKTHKYTCLKELPHGLRESLEKTSLDEFQVLGL